MKKTIRILLLLFFSAVLIFSAWQLLGVWRSYREGQNSYKDLEQYVSMTKPAAPMEAVTLSTDPQPEETIPENTEGPDLSAWPQVDFVRLYQINPDIVGWIYIEGTDINYPVVQGYDDDYYLNHLFDGTTNPSGCIFLDADCALDFSDRHSVIYGHNMKDKSMFHGLMSYKEQEFYDQHSTAMLVTPAAYYRIQFFSGYVSNNRADAWDLRFDDDSYQVWLNNIQKKSCFTSKSAPSGDDRTVTLSTCTYEFDGAKFVLHGYISEVIERNFNQK